MYRLMGLAHARLYRTCRTLSAERGQGTVEYVALVMLVAGIFAAVITAAHGTNGTDIAKKVSAKVAETIQNIGGK